MTDERSFETATAVYRAELLVHCYRMLGSTTDAEDVLQEVYLRAWKAFHSFEGRSSVRTWMYRIATNTCLTALEGRSRRPLPTGLGTDASDPRVPVVADEERLWLQPLPDVAVADPSDAVVARENVGLAMIAAMQDMPPRQRAVLILRDVLAFSASETADLLDMSVAGVNSALARARRTMGDGTRRDGRRADQLTDREQAVFAEFCRAFEDHDVDGLVGVLAGDAVWEMPPFPGWYRGAAAIGELTTHQCPANQPGDLRMIPTVCNGLPAAGMYMRDGEVWKPFQIDVVSIVDDEVTHVAAFFGAELFQLAQLPAVLDAAASVAD
ncbi:sigma-70 family RNA polymerase sigma factor [Gordonia sp. (in: high G+C Gram-positive bacteria)]|uniref:sigma-70 family RNA polymerase sigma factor n=1 Tax=Gordonia sp. (in: high G+C Gram-positive bacteria) TaxID=84139 RepID=UPI003F9C5FC9